MTPQTIQDHTLNQALRSTLLASPVSPAKKVGGLLTLNGLTNKQLAHRLGVHPVTFSRVLNGWQQSKPIWRKVAEFFQVEPEDFWAPAAGPPRLRVMKDPGQGQQHPQPSAG